MFDAFSGHPTRADAISSMTMLAIVAMTSSKLGIAWQVASFCSYYYVVSGGAGGQQSSQRDRPWLAREGSKNFLDSPECLGYICIKTYRAYVKLCMLIPIAPPCELCNFSSPRTKVYTTSFWMGAFQGKTPKRHRLWSNDKGLLDQIFNIGGYMSRESMQSLPGSALVRKYIDKQGQKQRVGIPSRLKQSQFLSCQ